MIINLTTRLAVNHLQFLSTGLGVKDMIHKQKVSLKAQDVVLFGPPKGSLIKYSFSYIIHSFVKIIMNSFQQSIRIM